MKPKKDLKRTKQDLRQVRACRKIAFRAHQAAEWLSRNFTNLHEDEVVANIVIGGKGATLPDSLTYGEVLALSQHYDSFCRQERGLRTLVRQLEEEFGEDNGSAFVTRHMLENSLIRKWAGSSIRFSGKKP